jgi:multidrug resistance protein, MATE family
MFNYSLSNIFAETRKSLKLSIPLIASQLAYGASGFIATAMIAHLGQDQLATHALVWGTFITLILFFIGILNAVSILVSQSFGAQDNHGIQQATMQGFILALLFAIPMNVIVWIVPILLPFTGQSASIIKLATPYFHSLGWCMLPVNILIIIEQFLIGISRSRLVMFISLCCVPLEILFFYLFIFGKFGFPELGLAGIGYGFAVSNSLLVITLLLISYFSKERKKYGLSLNQLKVNYKFLFELIRVGLPLGFMYFIEVGLFTVIAFMMGNFGETMLAAHQIAIQCFSFVMMIMFGVSIGASVRVGNCVGENNRNALKLSAYVNMGIGFCFMLIFVILYIGFPKYVMALDIDIHAKQYLPLITQTMNLLFMASILQSIDCFRLITTALLRSLKDTKFIMYVSLVTFWFVALPCSYILGFKLHFGGMGIWWGLIIGLVIGTTTLLLRFQRLVEKIDLVALVTR